MTVLPQGTIRTWAILNPRQGVINFGSPNGTPCIGQMSDVNHARNRYQFPEDTCTKSPRAARWNLALVTRLVTRTVPGGGRGVRAMPPKTSHRGPAYIMPQKPKPALLNPLGHLAELDFLSDFRARGTEQGPQDESGPRTTDQGPQAE